MIYRHLDQLDNGEHMAHLEGFSILYYMTSTAWTWITTF